MIYFKMTILLFFALLGIALGFGRTFQGEWEAIPNFFFGAMFFVMFLGAARQFFRE